MKVSVEFYGQSRIISGTASIDLEIFEEPEISSNVLCRYLVEKLPALLDTVISCDTDMVLPSYMCNLNGYSFVGQNFKVSNGDTVLVIPSQSGG
ncbi:MAG: hypothetical protein CL781_01025 [Chloroflexi bacterium]|nr:hypothetical protein [Chloroflexota bacterium]|tara:strand:+ start:403 stop:684 length:282 start_codon:yes stop_codon:yes gene_type:complete